MKLNICVAASFLMIGIAAYAGNENTAQKFIPKAPAEIYLGRVIDATTINKDKYLYGTTPFENITVSFSAITAKSSTIKPSLETMMTAAIEAFAAVKPAQSQELSVTETAIDSYSSLNNLFGQNISLNFYLGKSDKLQKTHRTLGLFNVSHTFFSMSMDMPEKAVTGAADNDIYVNSVSFGRQVIILVESELDWAVVKTAVKAALDAGSTTMLDEKSAAVLANSDIHIINIGEDNAITSQADNPLAGVKESLTKTPTTSNFGKIISFTAAYVKDNSVFVNKY
jgi:hypothetical protein